MAITIFAAISIGSYELEMKLFEISAKNEINEIERISHIIELGSETYNYKKISFELVDELCGVLYEFTQIMKTYRVKAYRACATSAVREAVNARNIIDRIKVRTGLSVDILSNSEQRYISYKAFAMYAVNFQSIIKEGTLLLDMGAGSAQITLFDNGSLITTQNIRLGSLRIREMLGRLAKNAANYLEIIEEYMDNDLETLGKIFLKDRNIVNMIATGENITHTSLLKAHRNKDYVTGEEFNNAYRSIFGYTEEQIAEVFQVSDVYASLVIPAGMLISKMFACTNAKYLWTPSVKLADGLVVEYAVNAKLIKTEHDFEADILSAARNISKRYQCNKTHTAFVEKKSLMIFDVMKKLHGLGKRERIILQISAILHDCGKYISLIYPEKAAYDIIMATEIIGLSHSERSMVAQVIKYNTVDFEEDGDNFEKDDFYLTVTKLTAILRVANALDRSHKQKMADAKAHLLDSFLFIAIDTYEDITLEKGLFEEKANFFQDVYGITPIIKQRKK